MEQNFSLEIQAKEISQNGSIVVRMEIWGYLTFDEAAFLQRSVRGMIYKLIDDGKFLAVKIGNISRVKRD